MLSHTWGHPNASQPHRLHQIRVQLGEELVDPTNRRPIAAIKYAGLGLGLRRGELPDTRGGLLDTRGELPDTRGGLPDTRGAAGGARGCNASAAHRSWRSGASASVPLPAMAVAGTVWSVVDSDGRRPGSEKPLKKSATV